MRKPNKKKIYFFLTILFIALFVSSYREVNKELPKGINFKSPEININSDDVKFLYDLTYKNTDNKLVSQQVIFDNIFELIDNSKNYILIDMFLFNSFTGKEAKTHRGLTEELTKKLTDKKTLLPEIKIDFITDPINIVYGGQKSEHLEKLKNAGINVIITNTEKLRDSNMIYSGFYNLFFKWFKNSNKGGLFNHPFSSQENKVTLRSYLKLINFKANHRKVIIADNNDSFTTIISSANPHNGSAAHSNVALKIEGNFWEEVYQAELAVAKLSNSKLQYPSIVTSPAPRNIDFNNATIQLLSEQKIKESIIEEINKTEKNDTINLGMFYLSNSEIINSLIKASQRDTTINIILDINVEAFGHEKIGIPNKQAAQELIERSDNKINIKWYNTHGEQFHSKIININLDKTRYKEKNSITILGSANYTRRNLDNYNLELNAKYVSSQDSKTAKYINDYFNKIWNNTGSINYTLDYSKYKEEVEWKKIIYKLQERTGLSTF